MKNKLHLMLIMLVIPLMAFPSDAAANEAMVVEGNARFTVLTPQLVRLEYQEQGIFEDRPSLAFIDRILPVPELDMREDDGWLVIETSAMSLRYKKDSGKFNAENLIIIFQMEGKEVKWHPGIENTANLMGTTRTVDGFEGRTKLSDGSTLHLEQGLLSRAGWSLIDDSKTQLIEEKDGHSVAINRDHKQMDWYFFAHGQDYKAALKDFTRVAGKIPMPPRYAFGYWWSRYWSYSDWELRELVKTIDGYDIPLDVLIVDMDWHKTMRLTSKNPEPTPFNGMLGWTGYSWDKALFPDPERFLDWTEQQNLKVALNLHPADGIAPFEDQYPDMLEGLKDKTTVDGWIPYRLADPDWSANYFEHMLRPLEKQGVDFWWLDWQQWPTSKYVEGLSNTFWLNHQFFTDMKDQYPQKRPLLFHRWGGLGNHRYQVGFSGDAVISWNSLAFQPYFTATASNVGYGYWSHDIGGHIVNDKKLASDGELYLRWLQFGALSPILRTHASKSDVADRRIWMYPQHFPMMRDAIQLRYSLVPYIYTAARQAYDSGVSIIRPMYYDYPEKQAAYSAEQQYMLGDDMIVSPVTTPVDESSQLAEQSTWLPQGKWFEWFSGTLIDGGDLVKRNFALDEIPIYIKAGSIIPRYPQVKDLQDTPEQLVLTLIPGGDDAIRLYEDDGNSQAYQRGEAAWTEIGSQSHKGGLKLKVKAVQGSYKGMRKMRSYQLELPNRLPLLSVKVNGKPLPDNHLNYDAHKLHAIVDIPAMSVQNDVDIEIAYAKSGANLNGVAGTFRRLQSMGNRLKLMAAEDDWGATMPEAVSRIIEAPMQIYYQPESTPQVVERMQKALPTVEKLLGEMPQISEQQAKQLANSLHYEGH
ncbi:glycoside hydrolase family 31 protein [Alteromonas ponticola]|uniref:DUF5110 domain-containing protein n=1 Tax=Alteromonas ponticola TaxID=2720613 RepID=A0ABX1R8M8_9ALTE|nr:glycoside hydrolase family 31 protein [Alteromonas ponticola]NMH61492.1 DUF5110 domain-containing protein [Alteromonas ponticola]